MNVQIFSKNKPPLPLPEKVNFRAQIMEHPSIGKYWNILCVPVLSGNVIFTFFRTCWWHPEANNTGTPKWSSIVQYSCTSIWDLKYTFPPLHIVHSWGGYMGPCLYGHLQQKVNPPSRKIGTKHGLTHKTVNALNELSMTIYRVVLELFYGDGPQSKSAKKCILLYHMVSWNKYRLHGCLRW